MEDAFLGSHIHINNSLKLNISGGNLEYKQLLRRIIVL